MAGGRWVSRGDGGVGDHSRRGMDWGTGLRFDSKSNRELDGY